MYVSKKVVPLYQQNRKGYEKQEQKNQRKNFF